MKKVTEILAIALLLLMTASCSSDEDRLFKAIKKGDSEEVRLLISKGVSVLSSDKNGLTALEASRLKDYPEVTEIIYEEVKKIVEKDINNLVVSKFDQKLKELKVIDRQRKKSYDTYLTANNKLLSMMSDDKRVNEEFILEEERFFREHQILIRQFINAKVDLIEDIQRDFSVQNSSLNVSPGDIRHIINVNIMFMLSNIN